MQNLAAHVGRVSACQGHLAGTLPRCAAAADVAGEVDDKAVLHAAIIAAAAVPTRSKGRIAKWAADMKMANRQTLRRSLRAIVAACGAAFVLAALASGAMAEASLLTQKSPEAAEITAIAQRQGYARVIVQFESPVGQIGPDPAAIADAKGKVAAVQDAIIASHFGRAANPRLGQGFERGLIRFDLTPAFAVNVSAADLEALAADPRVQTITLDRTMAPSR
jgi:hypothetical protein